MTGHKAKTVGDLTREDLGAQIRARGRTHVAAGYLVLITHGANGDTYIGLARSPLATRAAHGLTTPHDTPVEYI